GARGNRVAPTRGGGPLARGGVAGLRGRAGVPPGAEARAPPRLLRLVVDRPADGERVLRSLPEVTEVAPADAVAGPGAPPGALRVTLAPGAAPGSLNHALVAAGVAVSELVMERESLEDVFLRLTAGSTC